MRIAIASQNRRTVTKHAGKTRRFLVFEGDPGGRAAEIARIDLDEDSTIHNTRGHQTHPLDGVDVVVAGSAGAGFVARMAARGIGVVLPEFETDPQRAADAILAGLLTPVDPQQVPPHRHERDHHHDDAEAAGHACGCSGHGHGLGQGRGGRPERGGGRGRADAP